MIEVDSSTFHLSGKEYSYVFSVRDGKLVHIYYGAKLCALPRLYADGAAEYGECGRGDYRIPAVALHTDDCASSDFRFAGYEILPKPPLCMPALRGGETLAVRFTDALLGLELTLFYTPYEDGLARRAELVNGGKRTVTVDKLLSACVDLPPAQYDAVDLSGTWARECGVTRSAVVPGIRTVSSTRGKTSHQHNSFLAVTERDATEDGGRAYGFGLIYSGNFRIEYERDETDGVRVNLGEYITHGGIALARGEKFVSPEAVLVYSDEGLGGMSRNFHRLYRKHLLSPRFADGYRPIVINSWESMYFDFDEKKLVEFVRSAKGLGVDTVVLDDGWFGHRDDDTSSLGDWFVDENKLPNGLDPVIEACEQNGMKFGIWFEPEMINPKSELYGKHPDWCLHTEGREGTLERNQLVLDFSREEVVDYVYQCMARLLRAHRISYLKWDMNRSYTEVPSARKYHDCMLGVYRLYEKITSSFPDLFIEGCSGGGARFDAGILYYSPMIWTSDNTDAWSRARIQYGASLCYPLQALSNHVSACPNHQTGRTVSFKARGDVASFGCLGYELNAGKLTKDERAAVKRQTAQHREDARLIHTGDLYRLRDPYSTNEFAAVVVAEDKSAAYFVYMRALYMPCAPGHRICLKGLEPDSLYEVREYNAVVSGRELMERGVAIGDHKEDFYSETLHLQRKKP